MNFFTTTFPLKVRKVANRVDGEISTLLFHYLFEVGEIVSKTLKMFFYAKCKVRTPNNDSCSQTKLFTKFSFFLARRVHLSFAESRNIFE